MNEQVLSWIKAEARRYKVDDYEDFTQDILVRLLRSRRPRYTRSFVRQCCKWVWLDRKRKHDHQPQILYDSRVYDYVADTIEENDGILA